MPASSRSCATPSGSRRPTARTGSSSATSTPSTSVAARTASRPPPSTTSESGPPSSTSGRPRCWPGWSGTPRATTPPRTATPPSCAVTPCWPAWLSWASSAAGGRPRSPGATSVSTSPRCRNGCLATAATFFCDYVQRALLQEPALGADRGARRRALLTEGLAIHTSVDLRAQLAADRATLQRSARRTPRSGRWRWSSRATGLVRAISQSRPLGSDAEAGQTFLNFAVDQWLGDAAGFQAGSTFKAFVLASAHRPGDTDRHRHRVAAGAVTPSG